MFYVSFCFSIFWKAQFLKEVVLVVSLNWDTISNESVLNILINAYLFVRVENPIKIGE